MQQEAAADVEAARSTPASELCSGSLALQHLPDERGPLEAFYRFWYRGKSDAWRLLRSLATRLDGRAWPQRRRASVAALYDMIESLLGLRLQVRFFEDTELGPDGAVRRLGSSEYVADEPPAALGQLLGGGSSSGSGGTRRFVRVGEAPGLDVTARPRRLRLLRALRERVLRLVSRLFARRPRVTAREVLKEMGNRGLLLAPAGQ